MSEAVQGTFDKIAASLNANPDKTKNIDAVYQFKITGDNGGDWVVDCTKSPGEVRVGTAEAKCTITMADTDWLDMMDGKLNSQMAFMSGKLKVAGDMSLALKLGGLLQ